ncbi:KPN_02809 family neutral zinc metallopeptidase [Pedobacter mendelii]|uniref:Neutral zinc metallopeptidase n=1 Tax=Pedobacter mendelii TaxID=1908240 RepID=A0ABQ2BM50_9SPHI|nr:neutral zinc metallopeptidase [Pedobacter mendelii]GGI26743.1 neutral zinc metallopeptidase [Pedobacter mendelii]
MQIFGKGSENVEDSRGSKGGKAVLGGGVGLIIVVLGLFFGKDLTGLVGQMPTNEDTEVNRGIPTDSAGIQMSKILNSTDEVWEEEFQSMSKEYEKPTLRLFREGVQTACGSASADVGPFYCPGDRKVYIDLSFYDELANRFGAAGDFAQAYVLAHEVGHHVQNLLGISDKLQQARGKVSETEHNRLSVKLELQADFYAGLWAHNAQKVGTIKLDEGDLQEALTAANAIGDDKLQKQATGEVTPDSFTHGTSQQRMYWFKKGFETGDIKQGDTFNSSEL